MVMDLEVVGRHALLFDDDAMASFVNSSEALVELNSLSIDRYDVRHLLPGPLPPRLRRRPVHPPDAAAAAAAAEADLDYERYLDLPSSSDEKEQDDGSGPVNSGGHHAVGFSYGNPVESTETKNDDIDSGFRPQFPVPESLLKNLPPNEKVHRIIARTAIFVSKHGGQSEIILRVKQGDNPTFGFLMPDHHLHPYFRFLVDHQEFLKPDIDDGNSSVDKNSTQGPNQAGGALSLLGSVYGSGEDEDGATEDTLKFKRNECEENADAVINTSTSQETVQAESCLDAGKKDGGISKNSLSFLKEKVPVIKRNQSVSTVKAGTTARTKKGDPVVLLSDAVDNSQPSLPSTSKSALPIVEPPSDLKKVIEKIVEFILRNGKEFEGVLAEQDRAHGRFPFLLPSNQYHPYYLKVLQNSKESKLRKHDPVGRAGDKRSSHKDSENLSLGSVGSDLPYDADRKEKFNMVIGRTKKVEQESTSKDTQPQVGVTMDAAAAAAILQAATRGIKNPNIEIFTKTSSGNGQGPGSDGGHLSSFGSLHSSLPQGSVQRPKQNSEASVSISVPIAKVIAETAAIAAAGEADSSEACMTKEEKLKAERLKRARMFAAMIKGGAAPLKSEPLRSLSLEPLGSGISDSGAETGNLVGKEREGSSVPFHVDNSDKSEKSEEILVDNNKQRSKRSYRTRSSRHEEEAEAKEEESEEDRRDHKRSRKKHRSHRSSHRSRERHKHKRRHSSPKDRDSARGTKHVSSSDDEHQYSRHHREYDSSSDEKHHYSRRLHRESSLSDTEHRHSHLCGKHHNSSDDDRQQQRRSIKRKRRSNGERETDLEEGEIIMKSDQSKASEGGGASREVSVELSKSNNNAKAPSHPSEATNELRAKIRAMLMATL